MNPVFVDLHNQFAQRIKHMLVSIFFFCLNTHCNIFAWLSLCTQTILKPEPPHTQADTQWGLHTPSPFFVTSGALWQYFTWGSLVFSFFLLIFLIYIFMEWAFHHFVSFSLSFFLPLLSDNRLLHIWLLVCLSLCTVCYAVVGPATSLLLCKVLFCCWFSWG